MKVGVKPRSAALEADALSLGQQSSRKEGREGGLHLGYLHFMPSVELNKCFHHL